MFLNQVLQALFASLLVWPLSISVMIVIIYQPVDYFFIFHNFGFYFLSAIIFKPFKLLFQENEIELQENEIELQENEIELQEIEIEF